LEGVDYTIKGLWNERDSHYYLTIKDASGNDIVTGIKVVADIPFCVHESDDRWFPGVLWVIDSTGSETDPGLRDFGTRVKLIYVDEANVE
jgi:hypothetical protein